MQEFGSRLNWFLLVFQKWRNGIKEVKNETKAAKLHIGIQKIIATTPKNYCDHAKKLLRPAKKLLRPSKIFASIKSRAVLNTMFLDLIHRQFSVY